MRILTADDIARALTYPALIDALAAAFRSRNHRAGAPSPHHPAAWSRRDPAADAGLDGRRRGERALSRLQDGGDLPGQCADRKPSLYGSYFLMSGATGEPLAILDGRVLTAWRTGAGVGARRALSRPRGCRPSGHGGRRHAGAAPRARARRRAPDQAGHFVEPQPQPSDRHGVRAVGEPASRPPSPTISRARCARPTSCPARRWRPSR